MIRRALFVLLTFFLGWIAQAIFLHLAPLSLPAPHWLLVAVLAVGASGRVNLAQGLGFFWGLALDLYGQTPFGSQGLLLAFCGFAAGSLSKNLNAEKMITQEALTLVASVVFIVGSLQLGEWFVPATGPHRWSLGLCLAGAAMNALAAPAVFWALRIWLELGDAWRARAGARD
ncbi:MAG TPA: rod shape-determining protein MreD [Elusimicrobiota bacterium]|nr:rod shape-determining protein MreD [Elusimicrobiota bacterium]HMX94038.1 rod shape-determining protein MreD [Elusimicrobiota bacterium]HNA60892.1 rod shape-determining protein MreD [Elusimicrobiota bacterium]HNC73907.1 rod shape-determining protein MreD [Elusimicrobiota bacterium]HND63349.1 rod shape-determining protein MreD [Elusimicrobiota bacterium]